VRRAIASAKQGAVRRRRDREDRRASLPGATAGAPDKGQKIILAKVGLLELQSSSAMSVKPAG
jgi:hypothetical protein